jgi:hypothetical protein
VKCDMSFQFSLCIEQGACQSAGLDGSRRVSGEPYYRYGGNALLDIVM